MHSTVGETTLGVDKIEKYKWQIRDRKGEFRWINKRNILIDRDSYQRVEQVNKARNIASEWSWVACGAISVAQRAEGDYWAIDGATRLSAANRRSDIQDMPCMVFRVSDVVDEAKGFLRANTNRKPVSVRDKFRAMITAGDEDAIFVNELLESVGRTSDRAANGVQALSSLLRASRLYRHTLVEVWPVLHNLHQSHPISEKISEGLLYLQSHMPEGDSIRGGRWNRRLMEIGYDEVMECIRKASHFYGKGGGKVYAEGILARLNKGLIKKLEIAKD